MSSKIWSINHFISFHQGTGQQLKVLMHFASSSVSDIRTSNVVFFDYYMLRLIFPLISTETLFKISIKKQGSSCLVVLLLL